MESKPEEAAPEPPPPSPQPEERPFGHYAAMTVTFLLFLATATMAFLCIQEYRKKILLAIAVKQCKEHASFLHDVKSLSDLDVLALCQKSVDELVVWHEKSQEVQAAIKDISGRLQSGWKAHKGSIYLFHRNKMIFDAAVTFCSRQESHLVAIQHDKDEEIIEEALKDADVDHWGGAYRPPVRYQYEFLWVANKEHVDRDKSFWSQGEPYETSERVCLMIKHACLEKFHCWYAKTCDHLFNPICEQESDPKWK